MQGISIGVFRASQHGVHLKTLHRLFKRLLLMSEFVLVNYHLTDPRLEQHDFFINKYDVKEREMAFHPYLKFSVVKLKMFLKSDL